MGKFSVERGTRTVAMVLMMKACLRDLMDEGAAAVFVPNSDEMDEEGTVMTCD